VSEEEKMTTTAAACTYACNASTSAQEVAEFKTREAAPYTAYLSSDGKRITTWTGETLGAIISTGTPIKSRGWDTNTHTPFRARCIDGRVYFGRHNGGGVYLRMRPLKKQA
jgi:hypothetical protein